MHAAAGEEGGTPAKSISSLLPYAYGHADCELAPAREEGKRASGIYSVILIHLHSTGGRTKHEHAAAGGGGKPRGGQGHAFSVTLSRYVGQMRTLIMRLLLEVVQEADMVTMPQARSEGSHGHTIATAGDTVTLLPLRWSGPRDVRCA